MQYYGQSETGLSISRLALGTMRLPSLTETEAERFVRAAVDAGVSFLDEADIYGRGRSEELLGGMFARDPLLRGRVVLQSKVGIVSGEEHRYDLSKAYLMRAVEASLKRLQTEYLDVLLLHRPDALTDPAEVAAAFDTLEESGKVRFFGVSNHTTGQIALLQKHCRQKLRFEQVQLSIVHSAMIDRGVYANMTEPQAVDRDGDVLTYCMQNDILIQAWSPVQASWADGTFLDNPKYPALNLRLKQLAEKYDTKKSAVALAWILKHPARIQPILGTTSEKHLAEALDALRFTLTNQEWYDLYLAEGKRLP